MVGDFFVRSLSGVGSRGGRRPDGLGGTERAWGWVRAGLRAVGGAGGGAWRTRTGRCVPPPPTPLLAREGERELRVVD